MGYILICQSVFLKGVNDSVDVLANLFSRLAELGVRPYYLYHCQPIPATVDFVMDIEDEIKIMTELRERISGLAFPFHVLELQHTTGKVIVPTAHWEFDVTKVSDFLGKKHSVRRQAAQIKGEPGENVFQAGVYPELKPK